MLVKNACLTCHFDPDSKTIIGPGFFELGENYVEGKDDDGNKIKRVIDKDYIRESIINPNKFVRKGFRKFSMPTYKNRIKDDELEKIVNLLYLEELR